MVHRNRKETLDLGGVQVQRQRPVGARLLQQVCHQLGGNGDARLALFVLTGVAVVGNHGRDARRRSPLEGVDYQQQLHQVDVHRMASGLHHKDVGSANVLVDANASLAVAELVHRGLAQRHVQALANLLRQRRIGAAREHLELVEVHPYLNSNSMRKSREVSRLPTPSAFRRELAGELGFEPKSSAPKADVLPLDDSPPLLPARRSSCSL